MYDRLCKETGYICVQYAINVVCSVQFHRTSLCIIQSLFFLITQKFNKYSEIIKEMTQEKHNSNWPCTQNDDLERKINWLQRFSNYHTFA